MSRKPLSCPKCDGLGVVILERRVLKGGGTYRRLGAENCPTCRGVGHLAPKRYTSSKNGHASSTPTMESLGRKVQTPAYRVFRVVEAPPSRMLRAKRRAIGR